MTVAQPTLNVQGGSPTTDDLLDTPLTELLAELDVELIEFTPSPDYPPCGYAIARGGRVGLRLPAGQNRWEREMVARSMIGSALRVPMPELPAPFELSEMSAAI
ncbi:hypothetical protein ACIRF8_15300 [Streptomyces sp. NPDC102406]|uniref:hypothetical protein n=1 Tax=Streptomyces sp. NPDC102406 TaxID=3366171 RepID=UPI003814D66F